MRSWCWKGWNLSITKILGNWTFRIPLCQFWKVKDLEWGPEIAIESIEHYCRKNAQESMKCCSLSKKPTFQTILQVLCEPWKMLKTSKDTFWKVVLLIFCKVLKGYKWTFLMVTALKHTSVTNIFTTQEFKTFFCWSEAFSKLGSCLREICKVLSSPSPLQGYCGTSLSTWPLWNQAFHSG